MARAVAAGWVALIRIEKLVCSGCSYKFKSDCCSADERMVDQKISDMASVSNDDSDLLAMQYGCDRGQADGEINGN